mgnify:FL=1|jgi:hypothetical protein
MIVHMKATSSSAMVVKKTGIEQFEPGDIVQWAHQQKGRAVTAYGEVTSIMKKNMWVNLLGKEWKVSILDASLIHRPELKEIS